jgi:hypothetical protein
MFKMDLLRDEPADLPSRLILFHQTGLYQLLILELKSRHVFQLYFVGLFCCCSTSWCILYFR